MEQRAPWASILATKTILGREFQRKIVIIPSCHQRAMEGFPAPAGTRTRLQVKQMGKSHSLVYTTQKLDFTGTDDCFQKDTHLRIPKEFFLWVLNTGCYFLHYVISACAVGKHTFMLLFQVEQIRGLRSHIMTQENTGGKKSTFDQENTRITNRHLHSKCKLQKRNSSLSYGRIQNAHTYRHDVSWLG